MKQLLYTSLWLVFVASASHAQSPFDLSGYLPQKGSEHRAVDRSAFPVLLADSIDFEIWDDIGSGNQLLLHENSTYHYNNLDQIAKVETRRANYFTGTETVQLEEQTYQYDLDNREISFNVVETDAAGGFISAQKEEKVYSGLGDDNVTSTLYKRNQPTGQWIILSKNESTGDDIQRLEVHYNWDEASSSFVYSYRTDQTFDAMGNTLTYFNELWENGTWVPVYFSESSYDAQGNLLLRTVQTSDGAAPLQPSEKTVYTYNSFGNNILVELFQWDAFSAEWAFIEKTETIYNAENIPIESVKYKPDGLGNFTVLSRELFTPGTGEYSNAPELALRQIWDITSMSFLDASRTITAYTDLPNNQVQLQIENAHKEIPGQGDWIQNNFGLIYFHKGESSGVPAFPDQKICSVPNPYSTGDQVQCEQLKPDASYILSVYDLSGKPVYSQQFKGGDGWAIDQALPHGTYGAIITHNDHTIASYKLIIIN